MDVVSYFVDLLSHFDSHLHGWCAAYGTWAIALLALIIFAETGTLIFPFLPGDSMLFVVGIFCAAGHLPFTLTAVVLVAAAVAGDLLNYSVGRYCGTRLVRRWPWICSGHAMANAHFARHGSKTIVIARFVPVLRGFAPFAAGFATMSSQRFLTYNVLGGALWVLSLMSLGWVIGDHPWVRQNLSRTILLIIVVSLIPTVLGLLRRRTVA